MDAHEDDLVSLVDDNLVFISFVVGAISLLGLLILVSIVIWKYRAKVMKLIKGSLEKYFWNG